MLATGELPLTWFSPSCASVMFQSHCWMSVCTATILLILTCSSAPLERCDSVTFSFGRWEREDLENNQRLEWWNGSGNNYSTNNRFFFTAQTCSAVQEMEWLMYIYLKKDIISVSPGWLKSFCHVRKISVPKKHSSCGSIKFSTCIFKIVYAADYVDCIWYNCKYTMSTCSFSRDLTMCFVSHSRVPIHVLFFNQFCGLSTPSGTCVKPFFDISWITNPSR